MPFKVLAMLGLLVWLATCGLWRITYLLQTCILIHSQGKEKVREGEKEVLRFHKNIYDSIAKLIKGHGGHKVQRLALDFIVTSSSNS